MDQYVIKIETGMLYWDLMELYDLVKNSDNDNLEDYLPYLKAELNKASKNSIVDDVDIIDLK